MKVRWLGWAGVEIEADGATVVIDPLEDPGATFAALGDGGRATSSCRRWSRPTPGDAPSPASSAICTATTPTRGRSPPRSRRARTVYEPAGPAARTPRTSPWRRPSTSSTRPASRAGGRAMGADHVGPFTITALPAVDGLGDPQVSWLVEAGGRRVLHLGDTIFHGYWWRMARRHGPFDVVFAPINGAVVDFPHLQPPEPARRGDGARAGGARRRAARRADRRADALRRLRDRPVVPAR